MPNRSAAIHSYNPGDSYYHLSQVTIQKEGIEVHLFIKYIYILCVCVKVSVHHEPLL